MLYGYLIENFKPYEPIFTADIDIDMVGNSLRPKLKELCDSGKLCRYEAGVYYLPGKMKLKGLTPISASAVARSRYVNRRGKVRGYYSGYTFANQIGLSLQVPYVQEIVTNEASAKVREIDIKGQKFIIRKPKAEVTEENVYTLQFLDFLSDNSCERTAVSHRLLLDSSFDEYLFLFGKFLFFLLRKGEIQYTVFEACLDVFLGDVLADIEASLH